MSDIGPLDEYALSSRRRRIDDQYGLGTARNTYERGVYQGQAALDLEDLKRQLYQARDRLPGQYGGRGLLNSGIYQNALTQFLGDQQSLSNRFLRQHLDRLGGFTLGQKELDSIYQSATADIEQERAARRSAAAAAILGL